MAKAHKTLASDKVIGTGTLDLTSASRDGGFTNVPLLTELGKPGGVVRIFAYRPSCVSCGVSVRCRYLDTC